jgi:hypothetical protein
MKDNFDVHKWNLKRYLNESQESKQTNENQERKQTAVDWLIGQLNKPGFAQVVTDEEIKQAKDMEANQHSETWDDSRIEYKGDDYIGKEKSFSEYYQETYGK